MPATDNMKKREAPHKADLALFVFISNYATAGNRPDQKLTLYRSAITFRIAPDSSSIICFI